ncbi:hypothetical protein [Secundilactobacillus collinoides]|uniref:Uncharacterized protein n=1 Tax=Secundilactobacillus collinoides DSM 20515 = JCM 1123 TaxID=1423733 RepID=A0A0R2BQN4_SECCO|nr:hypothetical protein [Secundilactobacillus collinoides]KRM77667.1 hypothetical protein FC82_GL003036 [Secundilactobacillus collinoides DSM 20515 = JCM 1123]
MNINRHNLNEPRNNYPWVANITAERHEPDIRQDLKTYLKVISTIMQAEGRYR